MESSKGLRPGSVRLRLPRSALCWPLRPNRRRTPQILVGLTVRMVPTCGPAARVLLHGTRFSRTNFANSAPWDAVPNRSAKLKSSTSALCLLVTDFGHLIIEKIFSALAKETGPDGSAISPPLNGLLLLRRSFVHWTHFCSRSSGYSHKQVAHRLLAWRNRSPTAAVVLLIHSHRAVPYGVSGHRGHSCGPCTSGAAVGELAGKR